MNTNEVIANITLESMGFEKGDYIHCHPLDHINLAQSTNDVFPTAVKIAAIRLLIEAAAAMDNLQKSLQIKEQEFADIIKVGRTEMQDGVPITLGQEFSAYAQAIWRDWWRLYKVEERLRQVNLGGTAIGTGLNADKRYIFIVVDILREISGLPLARAENMIDVTQNCDIFVEVSGLLKSAAVNLHKISSDLRLLSSGPDAGFGEISLPSVQAGSSIMPGKVNPVITESVSQAAFQIMSNDNAITLAAMSGQLELNPFIPSIAHNLFESLELLRNAANTLATLCVAGISVNTDRCKHLLEHSMVMLTALSPYLGYEKSSQIAQESRQTGKTIRQIVLEQNLFEPEQLDHILSAQQMTKPGIAGKD
jgi:aspartate ammonia-lyase